MSIIAALLTDPYILVIFAVVFVLSRWLLKPTDGKLPPGPIRLPIVGYLPFLSTKKPVYQSFAELAQKYGNVFRIKLGNQNIVVLSSAPLIEEAFKMNSTTGRPIGSVTFEMLKEAGQDAIAFVDGPKWRFHRKLCIRALSIFGTSRESKLEQYIHENLDWVIRKLKESAGKPVDTKEFYVPCAGGIISSVCFGSDPNPENPFFQELVAFVNSLQRMATFGGAIEALPFLHIFYREPMKDVKSKLDGFINHVMTEVHENLENVDTENVQDLASSVEKVVLDTKQSEKDAMGVTDDDMRRMLIDMFDAGFFTTSETLSWATLLLATHPNVQEKLAAEVLEVVGTESFPSLEHHFNKLHYTQAVFNEVLRYTSLVALALPHRAIEDFEIGGYRVPKNSEIAANLWAVNHDPKIFDHPDEFRPERFMVDGSFSKSEAEKVMSFSSGKRRCLGEALAIQEVPIIVATLVQNFKLHLDPETKGDPVRDISYVLSAFSANYGPHKIIHELRR